MSGPTARLLTWQLVKFDHETDLSFKVGGILVSIGPAAGTDWDEGTPVKAGTVLAELKQADFTNALNSARAKAELAGKTLERFRKLRATDAISQQELDVTEADWRTAQAQLDQAEQNLRDSRLVAAKDGVVLARYVNSGVTVAPGQQRVALCRYQPDVGRVGIAGPVDRPAHARARRWTWRCPGWRACRRFKAAFRRSEWRRAAKGGCFAS